MKPPESQDGSMLNDRGGEISKFTVEGGRAATIAHHPTSGGGWNRMKDEKPEMTQAARNREASVRPGFPSVCPFGFDR
jgi:hypothetical protein